MSEFLAKTNTYFILTAQLVSDSFFKKLANPGLFLIYLNLFKHNLQFLQQINVKKLSIQYTVLGFKLMTFGI